MKKYIVFAGEAYYPLPGMGDFYGTFDTVEDAKKDLEENSFDWYQVVEHSTMIIVESFGWGLGQKYIPPVGANPLTFTYEEE